MAQKPPPKRGADHCNRRHKPEQHDNKRRRLAVLEQTKRGHDLKAEAARANGAQKRADWRVARALCYSSAMINLSQETEALAARLAAAKRISAGEAIRQALEAELRAMGAEARPRRRMTVEQMRALGAEIAALPLLDPRSPAEIIEDLNAL